MSRESLKSTAPDSPVRNDERRLTRRSLLSRGAALAAGIAVARSFGPLVLRAHAQDLPKLEESDPMAISFGYHHDAAAVDPEKWPKRAGEEGAKQFCHNCVQYTGDPDAEWGPCTLFPGKAVKADGWCNVWAPKA